MYLRQLEMEGRVEEVSYPCFLYRYATPDYCAVKGLCLIDRSSLRIKGLRQRGSASPAYADFFCEDTQYG